MMRIIGAMPAKTYMVGDAVVDIKTAQNAGIMPVGVLSGMASHDHLSSEGASMIFESMSHLASLLRCQS